MAGSEGVYVQRLALANPNRIATSRAQDVTTVDLAFVLENRLRVPVFQRRYCWAEPQWKTLLSDVRGVVAGKEEAHSIGRLTCACRVNQAGEKLLELIDGQQRCTSLLLLLAAIRDCATKAAANREGIELALNIDRLLFKDVKRCVEYRSSSPPSLQLGQALDFVTLVPTFHDRISFYHAVFVAPDARQALGEATWDRPWNAKNYFVREINKGGDQLTSLANAVLHKVSWLYFPVDLSTKDGTDNLNLIYERLAQRDASFCRPSRTSEFQDMGAIDFVRNLVLGSFHDETRAIQVYTTEWLPMEEAAHGKLRALQKTNLMNDKGVADILEAMLGAFLDDQKQQTATANTPVSQYMTLPSIPTTQGKLYGQFRSWFRKALVIQMGPDSSEHGKIAGTEQLVQQLASFAHGFIETYDPAHRASSLNKPSSTVSVTIWNCSRCKFSNPSTFSHCTACNLQRK